MEVHVSYVASTATKVEEEEVKGEEGKLQTKVGIDTGKGASAEDTAWKCKKVR